MSRVLACLGIALVAAGCSATTGDDGMIILDNTAPSDSCSFTGDSGQAFISHGLVDTNSPVPYLMTPLVASKITANAGQELQRTIQLRGAYVDLSIVGGGSVTLPDADQHFQTLFSGSISPGGTANVAVDLIPVDALQAIGQASPTANVEVQATIRVWGTLGGGEVDSAPFVYPVTACNGCVVRNLGTCPQTPGMSEVINACNMYQDGGVDCCTDATGKLICPATP